MELKKIARKLEGWNTVEDVIKKLKIKRTTAYVYLSLLSKNGFVLQKVKKRGGTAYSISQLPSVHKRFGMYENTNFISPELEFTKKEVLPEHKIAFFLWKTKTGGTHRYYNEAIKLVRKIKRWKTLYRYLKVYNVKKEFKNLYSQARRSVKKIPRMPDRYKKLLG